MIPTIIQNKHQGLSSQNNRYHIKGNPTSTNNIANTIVQNIFYFIKIKDVSCQAIVSGKLPFHFSIHLSLTYSAPH